MTFGGSATFFEPDGVRRGVGLIAPGRGYSPAAPLLEFARLALLQHGFAVQQIWWDTTTRGDEDAETWVRRRVAAAHEPHRHDRVVVVGKSLGTFASSYAAELGLESIWLTPLLVQPKVVEALAANQARQLLVGGRTDQQWDSEVARDLAHAGCDVHEVADADHSMAAADVIRTAEIHVEVMKVVDMFLSQV